MELSGKIRKLPELNGMVLNLTQLYNFPRNLKDITSDCDLQTFVASAVHHICPACIMSHGGVVEVPAHHLLTR